MSSKMEMCVFFDLTFNGWLQITNHYKFTNRLKTNELMNGRTVQTDL